MKESEVKELWCPMVRAGQFASNTDFQTPNAPFYNCRGSKCMMWDPEYDPEYKVIDQNKDPEEGWHEFPAHRAPKAIKNDLKSSEKVVVRYNPADRGDCGLKTKESGCFYPG